MRAYRNAQGKPTSERVAIGKLDEESGKLIPNRNYYELFRKEQPPKTTQVIRKYGTYAAFSGIANKLGLTQTLKAAFGEKTDAILTVAHYMLCEGNVMYYLSDWQDENTSYARENMSGAEVSRLFSAISESERTVFFNNWMKKKQSDEYIAYDVTSVSSYGKGMDNLEWGYNRDKEHLRQINFGMYYREDSKLPLYYRIYPGSITDKTHLSYMMDSTDGFLHNKRLRFVMDRDFYSAENLRNITEKGYPHLLYNGLEEIQYEITAVIGVKISDIPLMFLATVLITLPQLAIAIWKPGTYGGADIKIMATCAFLLGFSKGLFVLICGLLLAVICTVIIRKIRNQNFKESFALIPYLAVGCMIAFFI